jgi:hypothetical protein
MSHNPTTPKLGTNFKENYNCMAKPPFERCMECGIFMLTTNELSASTTDPLKFSSNFEE